MGAASRFSNDGGTFQILEVIAELLGTGESLLVGLHVGRFSQGPIWWVDSPFRSQRSFRWGGSENR